MAKNEAKIRFSAETKEFNDQIKQSNAEMGKLRAEMKLNDEQMKTTGTSVEGLQQRQKLLADQLKASQSKTEALSQKVARAAEIYGENSTEVTKLRTQLLTAQAAEEKINRAISNCNAELERQEAAASRVETETEKLSGTIGEQQKEVNKLKDEYKEAVLKFGATSDEAKELAGKIDTLSGELKQNKSKMKEASEAADDLDKSLDNASDNDGEGFTVFKGALADLISEGIQFAIGKVNELVAYMWSLPEATREIRQDFATLNTAFENVGFSSQDATLTWKGLYAVFGEDDRAVEAANNIARMAKSQQDLNDWVTITQGVWGTYQDALPVEGLAEAAGETAKVGTVTGGLADALNWSSEAAVMFADYMSEDVVTAEDAFNEALKECTTEQERQTLITDTLKKLYGEAAATFEEASGAQIDAKLTTAETVLAENALAEAIEPVTTQWNDLTNKLKTDLLPVAEKVSEWGTEALTWMEEHPVAMKVLGSVLGVVAAALTALTIVVTAYTIAQWAMNAAVLANPITWIIVGIVAAIAAIVAVIVLVIEYWDEIKTAVLNACQAIWNGIKTAWDWIVNLFKTIGTWIYDNVIKPVVDFYINMYTTIWNGLVAAWNWVVGLLSTVGTWIYDNIIKPVADFFVGLWQGIVNAFHTVIDPWIEIIRRASVLVYNEIIKPIADFFVDLWNGIVSGVQAAWDWIVNLALTIAGWVNENIIQPVVNLFKDLWQGIKDVFSVVKNWFNDKVVEPVKNVFTSMWDGLKNGAKNAWEGVKSVFSKVSSWFKDIFSAAWQKVKDVFSTGGKIFDGIKEGIASTFKTVVNGIIKGINKVIKIPFDAISKALGKIKSIEILGVKPFTWIKTFNTPQIPLLAEGGILTQPTLNIAGEAGPEAIIPIDKLQTYISGAIERATQTVDLQGLIGAVEDLANRAIELNINGQKFATATASDTDRVNGGRMTLSKRGLAL